MPDHSLLSILHISDFHFTRRRKREQEIVVDALIKDLEILCIGHRRPDIVMFTGDLVHAASDDEHDEAYDFLLARVEAATGCSDERVFIVPGNHDLARNVVNETRDLHEEWRNEAHDMDAVNAMYDAHAFDEVAGRKFAVYRDLEYYLSESTLCHRNAFVSVYYIKALNIDIMVLNTAIFSTGGHPDLGKDKGKLIV
jgi:3',5'-cyclic AMP phosphodiesterase CpdA